MYLHLYMKLAWMSDSAAFHWGSPHPVDTALKPVRACATVVSSRYSAWRVHPALWIPAYAGMTVWDALNDGAGDVLFTLAFDSSPIKGEGIL